MIPRSTVVLALALLAAAGPAPSAAVAAETAPAITNVTVQRSISVFAGVLSPFSLATNLPNISHQFLTIADANGSAFVDTTTTLLSFPNSLTLTGDGHADLTVTSVLDPPPASTCNVTVDFTTTVPTDFSLRGDVSSTNLALPSNDVATCSLTGPNVSLAFGKTGPGGPWVLSGDFSGVLLPGTYRLLVDLKTSTASAPTKQTTAFSNLAFSVAAFATIKGGKYNGLCRAAAGTAPTNATEGSAAVTVTSKGKFAAKLNLGPDKLSAAGSVDTVGRFLGKDGSQALVLKRAGKPNLTLSLIGNGTTDKLTGTLVEAGTNATSLVELDFAVYTGKKNPKAPLRNPSPALVGNFTVIFPPTAPAGQTLTPSITVDRYPQGTGWATLTVDKNGNASLKGKLADGSAVSCRSALSKDDRFPFYASLYGKTGSISGFVTFQSLAVCVIDGASLRWINPGSARAAVYPAGWPSGIVTDMMGAKFRPQAAGGPIPGIPTTAGAASIVLSDPVVGPPSTTQATITAAGKVSIVGDNSVLNLTVSLNTKTGAMTGSFTPNAANKKTTFSGVIVQTSSQAFGFFLNAPESGGVLIE